MHLESNIDLGLVLRKCNGSGPRTGATGTLLLSAIENECRLRRNRNNMFSEILIPNRPKQMMVIRKASQSLFLISYLLSLKYIYTIMNGIAARANAVTVFKTDPSAISIPRYNVIPE